MCDVSQQWRKRGGCGGFRPAALARRRAKKAAPPPEPAESRRRGRSEQLAELLKAERGEAGLEEAERAEMRRKMEVLGRLQGVVSRLQSGGEGEDDRRRGPTKEVRRLAKEAEMRETLAMLGAIPHLVGMLDSNDVDLQVAALYALLNLVVGNDMNKPAIVAAVHKMLKPLDSSPSASWTPGRGRRNPTQSQMRVRSATGEVCF